MPALFLNRTLGDLFVRARATLRMTQRQFGEALGASHRTAQRWDAGRTRPSVSEVCRAAVLVFPRDPALAQELAAAASETLESLGLAKPRGPLELVVEVVVAATADAIDASPATARAGLLAGLRRMTELGVTPDELRAALERGAVPKARGAPR
jgi:transcriptional regulator with XRE-family HTH domain